MNRLIIPMPLYQERPWGGSAFRTLFGRDTQDNIGEAWELSVHPHGLSRDASRRVLRDEFPDLALIFKLLDAREALSVQVHPAEGSEAKTEMWIVLHAEPGAYLYAGLREGETKESVEAHIRAGTMEQAMVRRGVCAGDCIFLHGGTVHALGAGIVVAEIQQPGDTTFRLYDWGRPRELHIEKGLAATKFDAKPGLSRVPDDCGLTTLAECPYFTAESFSGTELSADTNGKHTILFFERPAELSVGDETARFDAWTTAFLPKNAGAYTVKAPSGVKALIFQQNF